MDCGHNRRRDSGHPDRAARTGRRRDVAVLVIYKSFKLIPALSDPNLSDTPIRLVHSAHDEALNSLQSFLVVISEAVNGALTDAGAVVSDVGAAFFANTSRSSMEGQYMVGGEIALRDMGFSEIPISNVENACASASTAFHLAYAHLKAGLGDVALAIGAEKMISRDETKSMAIFDGAWDVHGVDETTRRLLALGEGLNPPPGREADANMRSVFMDVYAALAKFHMKTFGTTERQLAAVAAKNRHHSTFNPLSQYRNDMSIDEVLGAGHRVRG